MECAGDFAYFSNEINKVDTNIIEVSLSCLKQGSNLATGDPIFCQDCKSLLSSFSHLIRTDQKMIWECEFCGFKNVLTIEDEELPTSPELTYILESAAQVSNSTNKTSESSTIIFCIDISGSMCVSKPVTGILNLKTNKQQTLMKLIQPGEEEQYLPGANKNLTYVSRLECVQAAIESQLNDLFLINPNQKVGIVAFNNEVRVIGDGTHEEVIAGDKLFDYSAIKKFCEDRSHYFVTKNISQTVQNLKEKVIRLEEGGPTALGPALLISLFLASEGGDGSKVIICTDGLANVGLGSLETGSNTDFYAELGNLAAEKGVTVSVISIEGDECRLEALMNLTEASNGNIIRVAPENISEEFSNILSNDVIATHVTVEVTLHKAIQFRDEDPSALMFNKSRLQKKVGNATNASSFSFKYQLKPDSELESLAINNNSLSVIPMQAVFTYKSLEGMKCIRVINKRQPITFDRAEAKKNVKVPMLARAGRREAARMAEEGRFEDVRNYAIE